MKYTVKTIGFTLSMLIAVAGNSVGVLDLISMDEVEVGLYQNTLIQFDSIWDMQPLAILL